MFSLLVSCVTITFSRFRVGECHILGEWTALIFGWFRLMQLINSTAYIIYFTCLSAIAWLNVICYDIFISIRYNYYNSFSDSSHLPLTCIFRSMKYTLAVRNSRNSYYRRYALFAYSFPLMLAAFAFAVDHYKLFRQKYRPHLGDLICWFTGSFWLMSFCCRRTAVPLPHTFNEISIHSQKYGVWGTVFITSHRLAYNWQLT